MKSSNKTESQVIKELEALRLYTAELEKVEAEQKLVEVRLRASQERYRGTLDNMLEGCQIIGFDWRYLYVNDAVAKHGRHTKEELLGHTMMEMYPGIENTEMFAELRSCMEKRTFHRMENEFTFPDGSKGWFELSMEPMAEGVLVLSSDITERKRVEEALRESEEKYRNVVERANDGICIIQDGIVKYLNPRLANMWSATVEEFIDTPFIEHLHPDNLREMADLYKRRIAGEDVPPVYEITLVRKDGSRLYGEVNASAIKYEGKSTDLVIIRDITERKRAEEALQVAATEWRTTFNAVTDGICILDEEQKIHRCNNAMLQLLNKDINQIIGSHCWEIVHGTTEPIPECPIRRMKTSLHRESMELKIDNRWVEVIVDPILDKKEGSLVGAAHIIRDITERKWVEETLRESEEKYRLLAENARDIIWTIDMNLQFTYMSPSVLQVRGYTVEEVMAQSLDEVFTPSSLEIALKAFAEELALESMEPKDLSRVRTLELEHTCKDGSTVWVEINASFLRDTDGQPIGILGVSRDITDRRKSEEALRQSEEKYRTILKEIADSYFEVDLAGNLTFVNDATCRSLGYSREELVGMNYRGFTAEEDIKGVYQAFNEVHRTGEPNKGFLWKIVRKDGDIGFADASVSLLRSQGGEIIGFRGVGRDITERKQAEEKYQTIVRTTIDGFWLADMQGHFLDVNDAYCHLTGYSRDELLNMAITDVEAIEEPEETAKRIRKIKEVGYDRFETRHRRKEGEIIDVGISVNYLPIDGGRMFIFIRDVTERKRAEEERRQLEQKAQVASRLASVGEMAAGVAHEINNPLTGVMGYAQLLMDREEIPPDVRSDLAAINDGARRVAGIVQRLLVFSRQTKPQRKLVDINELIESTLVLRTYHLKVNNIKVATSLDHYLPETVADPGQIQQVLLNLIVNAETEMKLAHGKGKLTITTEKSDNTIKICVKDDGPGIKPAVIDRIFDPFFTTREVGQGTGLGLSLCYGIVAEHKGRIYAESQPGKGATFIVELPVVTEAKPPKRAEPVLKKLKKTAKARILVVDDEQVVRDVVNRVLTGEGHKVKTVDNVADALKKIESERYDLILLDIKMPGINGVELYKRIQKINKSLARRVAFITGDIMSADTEKFLSETKVAHIDKPFDAEQLIREVRHALTGGR